MYIIGQNVNTKLYYANFLYIITIIDQAKQKQRYHNCNIIFSTHCNDNTLLANTGFVIPAMKVL